METKTNCFPDWVLHIYCCVLSLILRVKDLNKPLSLSIELELERAADVNDPSIMRLAKEKCAFLSGHLLLSPCARYNHLDLFWSSNPVYLSIYLSIYPSVCCSVYLSTVCPSVALIFCLLFYHCICLLLCLFIYLLSLYVLWLKHCFRKHSGKLCIITGIFGIIFVFSCWFKGLQFESFCSRL